MSGYQWSGNSKPLITTTDQLVTQYLDPLSRASTLQIRGLEPHANAVVVLPERSNALSHNSDPLDEEFPLGDGSAATDAVVYCPYCNESVEIALDPGSGSSQQYVEDCEVCCQPWTVSVQYRQDGGADVTVTALDG